jgi:hypothetical protein
MMNKNHILLTSVICFSLFSILTAQTFDASSMAMGGAYGAVARGVNALAWNPANLVLPRVHAVELNLLGVNMNAINSSISLNSYNRYFTQDGHQGDWSDGDKSQILDLIPDNGLHTSVDANANALGVAFLYYGIHAEMIGSVLGIIPKTPSEMALLGNLKQQYLLNDTDVDGFSAVKIGFSAAHPIPLKEYFDVFSVGVSFNYFRGLGMAEVQQAEGAFYTGRESMDYFLKLRGRMSLQQSDTSSEFDIQGMGGGSGFGLDLGVAGIVNQKFQFSLVLKNLVAGINWDQDTHAFLFTSEIDSFSLNNMDSVEDVSTDSVYTIGSFYTRLPVVMHLGTAYRFDEHWLVSLDIEQAFERRMGYSDQAKLAIGAEFTPAKVIPLRAGMSFGGKCGGYSVGVGFGLHFYVFEFDFAYAMQHGLWPTYSRGASTALSFKFLF